MEAQPVDVSTSEALLAELEAHRAQYALALSESQPPKFWCQPSALVYVRRAPNGEALGHTARVRLVADETVPIAALVAAVRQVALESSAVCACLCVPLAMCDMHDGLKLDMESLIASGPELVLGFIVEHMDEKVGSGLYTAKIDMKQKPPVIGELEPSRYDVKVAGALGELLPQKVMN